MVSKYVKAIGLHKIFNVSESDSNKLNTTVLKTEYANKATSIIYIISDEEDELYGYTSGDTYTWGNGVLVGTSLKTLNDLKLDIIGGESDDASSNTIIGAKLYTDINVSAFKDSFLEDNEYTIDEFVFADSSGNIGASIKKNGINSFAYNIVDSSGAIKGSINVNNIKSILNKTGGSKYVLNSEDSGFYFSDADGNVVVYIDADGIHSVGYYDENDELINQQLSGSSSTATNRFTNKNIFSLCDSLGSGGHWQETFCDEVGAKPFNKELNGSDAALKAAGKTLSCGGAPTLHKVTFGWDGYANDGLTSQLQRAVNFVNLSISQYGSKDYLLLENINDFNYFETTDITDEVIANPGLMDPVFVEQTLLYTDLVFNSATAARDYFNNNISTVLANFTPAVNRSVVLKYGTAAYSFSVANNATSDGVLRITVNGTNYDTEISANTSVAEILNDIFIFNFPGFENTLNNGAVTISSTTVESSGYTVTVTDSTGAGVTVEKTSSSYYWSAVFTSHDVNDWLNTTKWETNITSMRAIMGIIEYLEQKLPDTHLIYILMPRFPFKWDAYLKADGTPDERAYKNVDIVKKFEKFLLMQKAVCEYYNLEYIDLAHTMGWNYTNMKKWYGNGTIHFNNDGHEYIGKFLANKL